MAVNARLEPLSTTAEEIVPAAALGYVEPDIPYRVAIKNVDAGITVYIGGSNVTSAGVNGYELLAGDKIAIDLYTTEGLWAVAASGAPSVRILEIGNKKV